MASLPHTVTICIDPSIDALIGILQSMNRALDDLSRYEPDIAKMHREDIAARSLDLLVEKRTDDREQRNH